MTEQPTHHHLVADTVQIKVEGSTVSMKVISPEELRAGAIVKPEPCPICPIRLPVRRLNNGRCGLTLLDYERGAVEAGATW